MERRLFNLYLKYIEESCPSVWERLGKVSKKLMAYLSCMVGFYVLSIIFLLIAQYINGIPSVVFTGFMIVFVILSIVFGCILFLKTEKYEIDVSDKTMKEYWSYCYGIRKWFQKDFLFDQEKNDEKISSEIFEVKKRLDLYLQNQSEATDKRNGRIDKWIQALAIPFVLAIITSVLEKSDQTVMAITEIFTILLVLAIFIGGIWVIYSVFKLYTKQKIEQMKYFSEDLQGALDCIKYYNDFTELQKV